MTSTACLHASVQLCCPAVPLSRKLGQTWKKAKMKMHGKTMMHGLFELWWYKNVVMPCCRSKSNRLMATRGMCSIVFFLLRKLLWYKHSLSLFTLLSILTDAHSLRFISESFGGP